MTRKQIWQTIALDLKRAANYMASGSQKKADYYLTEARSLYKTIKLEGNMKMIKPFIQFSGDPEDVLLAGTLIQIRA